MNKETQIQLGRRLLRYLDHPEECLSGEITHNDLSTYTCESQFQREAESLFRNHPVVLGFTSELREPGDFIADSSTGMPILLVRGRDGQANAFVNACRHRGAAIAEAPCGRARLNFACPYHGWVYDTEGRLVSIPERDFGFEQIDKGELGLVRLPVAEKHGMIWVLPNPAGAFDLGEFLGDFDSELAEYGFENYSHYQTVTRTEPFNWKLVSDGFWEVYHLKVLHKKTIDPIFLCKSMAFDSHGPHHRMAVARNSILELRGRPEADWDIIPHTAILYSLFPNTILILQGDHLEITRVFPGSRVDQCVVHFSLFTPEPPRTESARGHWQRNMDLLLATVEEEDFRVAASIQRAAWAGDPKFQVIGRYEPSLVHFHRQIRLAIESPVDPAVAAKA